jgi:hypothetical protein
VAQEERKQVADLGSARLLGIHRDRIGWL